ncbi:hypothetical protein [Hydrogenovibrio halophilus]|uniref:hypothetical protein n=1 Tax=Hydrogenovibrio halophilus TaxID=373391 RepID=UPI000378BEF2|nr:hypothetical protein [Hydrogenovibrio halophilus]
MNMHSILNAFRLPRPLSVEQERAETQAVEKKIVSRLARGNVSLQSGRYLTREELSLRAQKIAQHKFI